MAAWRGYTDHRDYGDEWLPREERPAPALIERPDRAASDRDVAPLLRVLRAMHDGDWHAEREHLRTIIAHLRHQHDDLRDTNTGIELALKDSAADLARQDRELAYLRTMNVHLTRTIDDLRQRLAGRDLTGWEW